MSDYTPTTEEVRNGERLARLYKVNGFDYVATEKISPEEFDRWLADVKAEAWEEGYDDGYVDGSCDRERADNPYRQGENK